MKLAELIRDVTLEEVAGQKFDYKAENWRAYPEMDELLLALGYTEVQRRNGFSLTRQRLKHVLAKALEEAKRTGDYGLLSAAVTLVPIWGYPRGVVGPGNRETIRAVHRNRLDIAKKITKFASARASAAHIIENMCYAHIGLSTLSKLLYFAELVCAEGPMLIYDQMVMRAQHHHSFAEYGVWHEYEPLAQRDTYGDFIRKTASAAVLLQCEPDIIEYALFREGQRLGPNYEAGEPSAHVAPRVRAISGDNMEEFTTFATNTPFCAQFHANNDVTLHYGRDRRNQTRLPAEKLDALRRHFSGAAIPLTATEGASLQGWLDENFSPTRLASYLGPVLVRLGYGQREGNLVRFL